MSRDFGYYWLRIVSLHLSPSVLEPFILTWEPSILPSRQEDACTSFIFGFMTFMSIGGFPSFVEDMKVFQRERMNGHYGVTAFVISNTLSAMPFHILIAYSFWFCLLPHLVGLNPWDYLWWSLGSSITYDIPKHYGVTQCLISVLTFGLYEGQYKNDLKGLMFDNQSLDLPKISGEYALKYTFQINMA
ncbi:hypothetical protein HAX54_019522 [Datura stramonium]|uniref:ABC-2 type transporter transmembrane domain-containing protein n=1 Tax=Datura stramonium TaxID=4076 RepID=A0ABS8URB0_DATST|nr:hypothetical protein [Datura stramonium]